tara:strand:+ start:254 stop:403 length:150 start_codon:yes stop_codon:yes gene_type:complete
MGSEIHTLKPNSPGLNLVKSIVSKKQGINNVIARDADALGKHRYNIHGK